MQKKVYELLMFQDQTLIYYFQPSNQKTPNYAQLQQIHRIQNSLGVSKSINALIKQIHPSQQTEFRNFKTKEYQFNHYDTINGLKLILITSIRSDQNAQLALKEIYDCYLNHVKKNYLFNVGDIIDVRSFQDEVKRIVKGLSDK